LCFGKCFFEKPSQSGAVAKTVTEQSHFVFLQVLTDSVQFGDRECFDATLGAFSNFNEPYYAAYINTDLGALCWLCSLFSPHLLRLGAVPQMRPANVNQSIDDCCVPCCVCRRWSSFIMLSGCCPRVSA